jgi:hypothetical protein
VTIYFNNIFIFITYIVERKNFEEVKIVKGIPSKIIQTAHNIELKLSQINEL